MRTENLHARRSSERIGRKLGAGQWAIGAFFFIAALPQASGQTLSLTASDHNEYNISCFGGRDGSIDLTVTGGTPPYTYTWSHGPTTQDVSSLAAGYYSVDVVDANNNEVGAFITLTEPRALTAELTSPEYGNGFNISLFGGYDGSIALAMDGGVAPYTYLWTDGPTTQNRTQLNSDTYRVRITDANACELLTEALFLRQPDRSDWTMTGNAGTNPATHFFGTPDNKDVVFKSNGAERLRLLSSGGVRVPSLSFDNGYQLVVADSTGKLKLLSHGDYNDYVDPCEHGGGLPWTTCGNVVGPVARLGTRNDQPLKLITNNTTRVTISTVGKVGLGTSTPADKLDIHHTEERGGISLSNNRVDANAHNEIRFMKDGEGLWALGNDFAGDGTQDFFLWDQNAGAKRVVVDENGKVGIGTDPPSNTNVYKLYVADGIATRDIKVLASGWPDYVFAPEHELLPLCALRTYLEKNRHLPGIPPVAEIIAQEGYEVGDMQARILKVVEEQALYILQLEQRIRALEDARSSTAPAK